MSPRENLSSEAGKRAMKGANKKAAMRPLFYY